MKQERPGWADGHGRPAAIDPKERILKLAKAGRVYSPSKPAAIDPKERILKHYGPMALVGSLSPAAIDPKERILKRPPGPVGKYLCIDSSNRSERADIETAKLPDGGFVNNGTAAIDPKERILKRKRVIMSAVKQRQQQQSIRKSGY